MLGKNGLGNLMKQAQQMQQEMQQKLKEIEATGEAGAGMVKITINGDQRLARVQIDESVMNDRELLEDLIIAAHNQAHQKVSESIAEKTSEMTGGLPIPPGMKLPF